jgi:hypothetical protein
MLSHGRTISPGCGKPHAGGTGGTMGTTYAVVAVRTPAPPNIEGLELGTTTQDGWALYRPSDQYAYPSKVAELTSSLARLVDGPAVAGFVEDSDWACVLAATQDGPVACLVMNPEGAEGYAEGGDALNLASQRAGDQVDAVAMWSQLTSKPIDSQTLRKIVEVDAVVWEQPLAQAFEALGIVVPWDW